MCCASLGEDLASEPEPEEENLAVTIFGKEYEGGSDTLWERTLLGAPGIATRSKDATRGSWPYY